MARLICAGCCTPPGRPHRCRCQFATLEQFWDPDGVLRTGPFSNALLVTVDCNCSEEDCRARQARRRAGWR